ncbi:MAG: hypothetical protein HY961_16395 [Ignavibacteriae bacterium]|nr:hypothetical protein [Ignavibacteriota bacterium]
MQLSVKLRDGFSNDSVTIYVDGTEVYRKSGVTTDLSTSTADVFELTITDTIVKFEVSVAGGPPKAKYIRIRETPFVEVLMIGGDVEIRASREEIPML